MTEIQGARLKVERLKLDLSPDEAAHIAGVTLDEYKNAEHTGKHLSISALHRLLKAGFDTDTIIMGTSRYMRSANAFRSIGVIQGAAQACGELAPDDKPIQTALRLIRRETEALIKLLETINE